MRLLGPVQVIRAGREVALGGPKQRAVLALLVLEADRVVPADRLVEEVWRGSPPPGAVKTLRSYVSRLRALLAPEADLVARGGGYVISLDLGLVDTYRFERLAAAGQGALGADEAAAAGDFREALGLWRGRALADVSEVEPLALEAARLEELRLAAVEGKVEADLALGRAGEVVGELERLVGQARLVTLTGPGGAGKTRLAVEAAARAVGRFGDGVWLADLAGVASAGLVAAQVMAALGVRQEAGVPVLDALRYRLRSAQLLLVLDNCEHLLDACAQLARVLLAGSPGLVVLATSREPLGVPGEVAYPVPPLALPPEAADAQAAAAAAAVRLFLDRGSAARGGAEGVAPVAVAGRICRTLDGLPLAIELAAARIGTLSATEIEAQLTDRFAFLAYRRPVPDPRHQALRAAMDWSYDLLTAEERDVFDQLSVFAGSFGLAQLAEVCAAGDQAAALEVIDRLANKSLVSAEPTEDGTRYRLLETLREYAAARFAKAGDTQAARQRHARAFSEPGRAGTRSGGAVARSRQLPGRAAMVAAGGG